MIIAGFSRQNASSTIQFFEETFLFVDTSIYDFLKMLFLVLNNADIQFNTECFTRKTYNSTRTLAIFKWIKLINKQKFVKVVLDKHLQIFDIHVIILKILELAICSIWAFLLAVL